MSSEVPIMGSGPWDSGLPGSPTSSGMRPMARRGAYAASVLLLAGALVVGGVVGASAFGPRAAIAPTAAGGAASLQSDYIKVVNQVAPSVVVIETSTGLGSGIVFDRNGDIVTNAHVTAGASTFIVTLADGRKLNGTLVGTAVADDLAVIHVTATNLQPAAFADSTKLVVGDIVMAVGNPLGLQSTATEGIVSALGRSVTEPGGVALPNTIQTSAAINPGNSGGALVNLQGSVVGIPTLAASDPQMGGAAVGIGFAIPSSVVTNIANQLITYGKVINAQPA